MLKNGLGKDTEFTEYHPLVNVLFYVFTIGITMFSMSPWFLAVTTIFSWGYSILLNGTKSCKNSFLMAFSVLLIMVVMNFFFVNDGETVLFYINSNRITLEAACFGFAAGIMLISVFMWFSSFNVIMSADKIIYLFGKIAPVLGLTLSMIFRFVPLLKDRFAEISLGQKCMGRSHNEGGLINKARQLTKELSILIAWSLEASIESADSMEARGYGLKGRTSFHLFKFYRRDIIAIVVILLTGIPVMIGTIMGETNMYFYPKVVMPEFTTVTGILLVLYIILQAMPLVIDVAGEYKWKQLDLKM